MIQRRGGQFVAGAITSWKYRNCFFTFVVLYMFQLFNRQVGCKDNFNVR